MKWLFSFFTLFLFSQIISQGYPPMVVEGATWIYQKHTNGTNSYFAYHIKGDTSINGVQYAILNDQGLDLSPEGLLSLNSTSTPIAYLRENVETKKVYALIDDATQFGLSFGLSLETFEESHLSGENTGEYLLYDFSLEEGDYFGTEVDAEIISIEAVEIFGYDVRKFDVGKPFYEKIGYEEGLFFPHHIYFVGGDYLGLIQYCVTNNFECVILVDPLSTNVLSPSDFLIYPNPVSDILTIEVQDEILHSVQIFSTEGKLIFSQEGVDSKEFSVDLSRVKYAGIIFIEGLTSNSRFVERVIKF